MEDWKFFEKSILDTKKFSGFPIYPGYAIKLPVSNYINSYTYENTIC